MSISLSPLLLPTPDVGWQLCHGKSKELSGGESVVSPAEVRAAVGGLVVGLPASACRSLGLVLPMAEQEVLGQMVETQLERQGLRGAEGEMRPHRWHLLGQLHGMALVSVDVLAEPFPEHLLAYAAADYAAALRLLELPQGQLVLTVEQDEWVVAVGYHGHLFHSHVVGPLGMDEAELATELRLTLLGLDGTVGFDDLSGVTVVGGSCDCRRLEGLLGVPVAVETSLRRATVAWKVGGGEEVLLPVSVRQAREAKKSRAKWLRFGFLGGLLYVALVFLGFAYLRFYERQVAGLEVAVEQGRSPAAAVRGAADAWKSLAPAVDENRFPMVLMAEVTGIMPPSGIVLRQFTSKLAELELRGEARDAQLAYQFLEDLQKHRVLSRYEWSMPQPSVREKTASFRVQGKLK